MSDGNGDLGASMQGFLEELDAMPTAAQAGLTNNAVAPGAQDLHTDMKTPTKQFLRVATDFPDEQKPMSSTPRSTTSSFSSASGFSTSSKKRRGRRPATNATRGGLDMYERSMLHMEERELKLKALEKTLLAECTFTPTSSTPNSRAGSRASSPTRGQVFDRLYAADTAATRAQRSQRYVSTPKSNSRNCSPMAGPRISALHASGQKKLRARKKTAKEEEEARRKRREEEELAECTFTPQTKWRLAAERRRKARARAAHEEAEAVHKRTPRKLYSDLAARERRQKDKEAEELQECTFRPRLKWNIIKERQGTPPSEIWDDDDVCVLPREVSMRQTPSRTSASRLSVSTIGTSASTLQKTSSSSLPPDVSPLRSTKMDFDSVDVKFVSTDKFKEESGKNIAPPPVRSNYIGSVTPTQTEWKKRYDTVVKDKSETVVSGEGSAPSKKMQVRGSSTIVAGGNKPKRSTPKSSSSARTATKAKTKTSELDQELNDALESPLVSLEEVNTGSPQINGNTTQTNDISSKLSNDRSESTSQLSTAASKESVDEDSAEQTAVKGLTNEKKATKGTKWHQRILGKRFGLSSKQENTEDEPAVGASESEEERLAAEQKETDAKQKEEEERLALEAENLSRTITRIETRAGEAKQKATEEKNRMEAEAAQKAEDERLALEAEESRKRIELAAEEAIQKAEKERLALEAEKERKRVELAAEEAKQKADEERRALEAEKERKRVELAAEEAEKERLALEAAEECKRIEIAAEEAIKKAAEERLAMEKAEEKRKKRLETEAKQKAEEEQVAWDAQEERKRVQAEEERKRLETEAKQKAEEEHAAWDAHEERKRVEARAEEEAKQTAENERLALEAKEKAQEVERQALEAQWEKLAETEAKEAARISEEEKEERLGATSADLDLNLSGDHPKESVEVVSVIARNAAVGEGTVNSLAIGVSMDISEGISTGISDIGGESLANQSFESVPSLSSERALRQELAAVLQPNENDHVSETEKGIEVECALEDDVTLKARKSERRKLEHEVIQNDWDNVGLIGELTGRLEERKEETETQNRRVAEMEADLESRIKKEEGALSRSQHTSGSSESGLTSLEDDNLGEGKKKKKSDRAKKWKARLKKKGMKSNTGDSIQSSSSDDLAVKVAESKSKAEESFETNVQSSTQQNTKTETAQKVEVVSVPVVSAEMTEEEKLQEKVQKKQEAMLAHLAQAKENEAKDMEAASNEMTEEEKLQEKVQKKQQAMLALLAQAKEDEDRDIAAASIEMKTDEEKLEEKVQKKQQAMLALLAQAKEEEDSDLRLAAKLDGKESQQSPEEVKMKANENAMLHFLAQAKEKVDDSSPLVTEVAAPPSLKEASPIVAPSDSVESFPTPEPREPMQVESVEESTDDCESTDDDDEALVGGDETKKKKKSSDRAKKWKDRLAKKTKGDSKRKKEASDAMSDAATAGGEVEKEVFPRVVYSDKDTTAIKEPAIGSI